MALAFKITGDDEEGGMHVCRVVEYGVGVRESWGGDSGYDVVVVTIFALCLGDFAYVRERADVSAGSNFISGILHKWYTPKIKHASAGI